MNKLKIVLLTMVYGLWSMDLSAKEIPTKSNKLVNDYAGVLQDGEVDQLERKLEAYYDSTSTQIVIVLENSLDGDDLFDYSQRLATAWGIGEKGKNNGILVYAAIQDRKLRIHTGYGMEATVTDALTTRIRTEYMNPYFKEGNYYQGLDEGTTMIIKAAAGEFKNDQPKKHKKKNDDFSVAHFVIIAIIIILAIIFRNRGGGRRNRGWGGPVFWGTFGSGGFSGGGFGGGGSSSGGFGGFGGGSFGGGGSGGSW